MDFWHRILAKWLISDAIPYMSDNAAPFNLISKAPMSSPVVHHGHRILRAIGEYWTIYRGPGFLGVVWFGSSPTSPSSPVGMLDWRNTRRLRKRDNRDNLLTGEGITEEPNHTTARKPGPYKSFITLWGLPLRGILNFERKPCTFAHGPFVGIYVARAQNVPYLNSFLLLLIPV
jgi:hypothetical protein